MIEELLFMIFLPKIKIAIIYSPLSSKPVQMFLFR